MLGTHKLIVDEWAEVYDLLKPYADHSFWQWPDQFDSDATYVVGRVVLKQSWQQIVDAANRWPGRIVFSNPAEGSETIKLQLRRLRITELVKQGKILLLTSGDMEPGWQYCKTDCYFSNIVEYTENLAAAELASAVRATPKKLYDFIFLNGRLRPHRKYLIDRFKELNLLDRALWTNLNAQVEMGFTSQLVVGQIEPIRLLPPQYEIERALPNMSTAAEHSFAKHHLFGNTWGDAIVNPWAYIDSCFSVVTETIYDYPYTFRTEKIWKPMIMQHPFVVAANAGFYRDLHRAGFRTFGHLIDETFDSIDDPRERAERLVAVVQDICYNGAASFLKASEDVCKYNYQHLREHNARERELLPKHLFQYLNARP
jgi:hypothetical protein